MSKGWHKESYKHYLAGKGVKSYDIKSYLAHVKKQPDVGAQPVRAQLSPEISNSKNIRDYVANLTAKEIKRFGPYIVIDLKYRGMRGLVFIDKSNNSVKIFSRNLVPLDEFAIKYGKDIVEGINPKVKNVLLDTELFALTKDGRVLPQQDVIGFVKNPLDDKYNNIAGVAEVFDIVEVNGHDVRDLPTKERKKLINEVVNKNAKAVKIGESWYVANDPKQLKKYYDMVIKQGHEGLVIKNPEASYFYGKHHEKSDWIKMKNAETLDLRLKGLEAWPRGNKPFMFYKHLELAAEDSNKVIRADKGIPGSGFDFKYFEDLTKRYIKLWKEGKIKAKNNKMVVVSPKYAKIYKTSRVPYELNIPKQYSQIYEIHTEEISKDLTPAGQKLVAVRDDKKKADTLSDIRNVRNNFYGVR
jgi:ATP-dependent DNA ligase